MLTMQLYHKFQNVGNNNITWKILVIPAQLPSVCYPLAPNTSFAVHRFCIHRWGFNRCEQTLMAETGLHAGNGNPRQDLYPGVLPGNLVCSFMMMVQAIYSVLLGSRNESWAVTLDLKDPVSWALCHAPWILCNFCHNGLMRNNYWK